MAQEKQLWEQHPKKQENTIHAFLFDEHKFTTILLWLSQPDRNRQCAVLSPFYCMSQVCRKWANFLRSDSLWEQMYRRDFCSGPDSPVTLGCWREAYKSRLLATYVAHYTISGKVPALSGVKWLKTFFGVLSKAEMQLEVHNGLPPQLPCAVPEKRAVLVCEFENRKVINQGDMEVAASELGSLFFREEAHVKTLVHTSDGVVSLMFQFSLRKSDHSSLANDDPLFFFASKQRRKYAKHADDFSAWLMLYPAYRYLRKVHTSAGNIVLNGHGFRKRFVFIETRLFW
eukprot:TRINITY_DN1327_c0_g1_i5.p1 TRINITY_DN1327_c0_g1~~TRINITY_DN1327_c0_g1_i5.p1  ORF type:complete len:286 (-),score=39.38 TRINITY_DN1327_c0_g1_i5:639-1496(-)